jgi:hypothetical protein
MLLDLLWGALALALPALLLLGPAAGATANVSDSQKLSTFFGGEEQQAAAGGSNGQQATSGSTP